MYTVFCDSTKIYDPSEELVLISPVLDLEDNLSGSFKFGIDPTHAAYSNIDVNCEISVYEDGEWMWSGRVTDMSISFNKIRQITCEGELAYLNDSIQEAAEYHDLTVRETLEAWIAIHNTKCPDKQFTVGIVTVTDSNGSLYRLTNYDTTLYCISDKLVNRLGGHIRIRHDAGVRKIDYLADYPNTCSQNIEFGKNLVNYVESYDFTKMITVLIPLGAKLAESPIPALEARTTIASVNDDEVYLESDAVETYGRIEGVQTWDDVTVPSNLKTKGEAYLAEAQFANMVLTVTAVDLHKLNPSIERVKLLDQIRAISAPHSLNKIFPVTKMSIALDKPASTTFTLGSDEQVGITAQTKRTQSVVKDKIEEMSTDQEILAAARTQATELINTATHGYVITEPNRILIMDTNDINTATKIWQLNLNGFGYSGDGGQTYGLAITMDGQIVGEYILANSIKANSIDLTDLFTQNITATNLNITGGSIHIDSNSSSRDVIKLTYGSGANEYYTLLTPSALGVYGLGESQVGYYGSEYANVDGVFNGNPRSSYMAPGLIRILRRLTSSTVRNLMVIFEDSINIRDDDSSNDTRMALGKEGLWFYNASGTLLSTLQTDGLWFYNSSGDMLSELQTASLTFRDGTGSKKDRMRLFKENLNFLDSSENLLATYAKNGLFLFDSSGNMKSALQNTHPMLIGNGTSLTANFIGNTGSGWTLAAGVFRPTVNNDLDLGGSSYKWKQIYAVNSTISTSDRREKKKIKPVSDKYLKLFDSLEPVTFNRKGGDRVHIGFISQDVESALEKAGMTAEDFAGFCKDVKMKPAKFNKKGEIIKEEEPVLDKDGNPDYNYGLRYEEFIALNTAKIKAMEKYIDALEARVAALEKKLK